MSGQEARSAAQDRCECGADPGDINFDRSICACGSMHYFCNQCGTQAEPCSDDHPAACTCPPGQPENVTDAQCPIHGVAAFLRSLPVDPDDSDETIEVNDGFGI